MFEEQVQVYSQGPSAATRAAKDVTEPLLLHDPKAALSVCFDLAMEVARERGWQRLNVIFKDRLGVDHDLVHELLSIALEMGLSDQVKGAFHRTSAPERDDWVGSAYSVDPSASSGNSDTCESALEMGYPDQVESAFHRTLAPERDNSVRSAHSVDPNMSSDNPDAHESALGMGYYEPVESAFHQTSAFKRGDSAGLAYSADSNANSGELNAHESVLEIGYSGQVESAFPRTLSPTKDGSFGSGYSFDSNASSGNPNAFESAPEMQTSDVYLLLTNIDASSRLPAASPVLGSMPFVQDELQGETTRSYNFEPSLLAEFQSIFSWYSEQSSLHAYSPDAWSQPEGVEFSSDGIVKTAQHASEYGIF